jgi:hypothetical protein
MLSERAETTLSHIPLLDYAGLDQHAQARLRQVVAELTTLERALDWGRRQQPPLSVEAILTQDEYTHDVLIPYGERYLVFDTT